MSMLVLRQGLLDTIQDDGRKGYSHWGINPGGVMDFYSAQVANALVGNDLNEAVLEMHYPASQIQFHETALVALTGGDFDPAMDGTTMPRWRPVLVKKGSILSFRHRRHGSWMYLAVQGGYAITPWLNSCSTNIKVSAGGLQGRALKKGDLLPLKQNKYAAYQVSENPFLAMPWEVNIIRPDKESKKISFTDGREWKWLTEGSRAQITSESFSINPSSDRMGYHVKHPPLSFETRNELLSSAVTFGTMQALPNGQMVVLMADHQTTGGYPCVGHIATAHLPALAQLQPGEPFYLNKISVEDAEKILFSILQEIRKIKHACHENLQKYFVNQ